MSPKEAGEILKLSTITIKRMIQRGDLVGTKLALPGKRWRWDITKQTINDLLKKYGT